MEVFDLDLNGLSLSVCDVLESGEVFEFSVNRVHLDRRVLKGSDEAQAVVWGQLCALTFLAGVLGHVAPLGRDVKSHSNLILPPNLF